MQALTVRAAGVEGVMAAIANGMKAGEYARALDAAEAEIEALKAQNAALKNELAMEQAENRRLRKENRKHRARDQRSREAAWQNWLGSQNVEAVDVRNGLIVLMVGMVLAFAVITCVMWFGGVR